MRHTPWTPLKALTAVTALAALASLAGCTHTRAPARVDGLSIRGDVDPLIGLESYTADDVLTLADEAFDASHYERAAALYARYLEEFPGLIGEPVAQFNLGLSLERSGRFSEAADAFAAFLEGDAEPDDVVAARFHLSRCAVEARQWGLAAEQLEALMARPGLTGGERFEVKVLRSFVRAADDEPERGVDDLQRLTRRYRTDRGRTYGSGHGAMAYYYLGEAHRLQAEASPLTQVDDPAAARAQLNAKAEQILAAQDAYLQCIRTGERTYIPRAGLQLGGLYAGFRDDILTAAYPEGVETAEDRAIYDEILDEGTVVLLEKTRRVYEKVLDKATEVGLHDEYVIRLREGLKEVETELIGDGPSATL